jgi:urease alpha subunit
MDFDLVIKNANLVTPLGVNFGEIGILDGRIAAIGSHGSLKAE